jgi:inosine-uridine nucleoside N-ribohydrolase
MENNNFSECWIIDTDYSLDDQLAISYLTKHLNVIAITVNSAGTGKCPSLIKAKIEHDLVNKHGNPNIKVYQGCDRPFIDYVKELKDEPIFNPYNFKETDYNTEELIKSSESESVNKKLANHASVKIPEYVRIYGKKLNILTLGPLTNLSLAVVIDSEISSMFNKLYVVGGSFNNQGNSGTCAEYNFRADPVAAKNVIFYYKNVVLLPLEIEGQLRDKKAIHRTNNTVFNEFVDMVESSGQNNEYTQQCHSMLGLFASVVVCHSDIIKKTEKRAAEVDIAGRYSRGALAIAKYIYIVPTQPNDIEIVEEIDTEVFAKWFSLD